jgi:radical SAM superfamily enzyme YgiQ (UPF0313 family)
MRVLLISSYELGHQPLHVASPAAALRCAGHEVRCLDLAVERWRPDDVEWAERVAFSVPMHTAMRLAVRAAEAVRRARPELPICFYGLYAPVSRDRTLGRVADRLIAGEYEPALVRWASAAEGDEPLVQLGRGSFEVPARELLPPLDSYAHLALGGEERVVGYVEASHGCVHMCRHCPIPSVYDGRIRIVGADTVLADVEQLVAMGARHITFGDPDFLNGRRHSLEIVRAMHERFPELTFDCTTKVEHVLEFAQVWPELAAAGCLFAVMAVEILNDEILARLDKGHSARDVEDAVALLREHGIEPRPSLMPFTPWTTREDVADVIRFVERHDLVGNVDPVQLTIRLLVPEGSLILDLPDFEHDGYDPDALSYRWTSELDPLQARLAATAEEGGDDAYARMRELVLGEPAQIPAGSVEGRPRLTEPWFC